MSDRLRVLELFAGIGGCASAIGNRAEIVAAIDTDPAARSIYQNNFTHSFCTDPIESLSTEWLHDQAADVWWLSPPTLPFVHAGLRRELDDPRAKPLIHAIEQVPIVKPRYIALEAVFDFNKSLTRQVLHEKLTDAGYEWQETTLCPTQLGLPNRRPRFYLVAGLNSLRAWNSPAVKSRVSLASTLDNTNPGDLGIVPELLAMHRSSMDVVDAENHTALTSCFTPDYGRSVNKTGSYLQEAGRVRCFSPTEMLRQLGFPNWFKMPDSVDRATSWRLIGNSSSVPATKAILDAIPGLLTRQLSDFRTNNSRC